MSSLTHEQIHQDHRQWQSDLAFWSETAAHWQREQQTALAELEAAIASHQAGIGSFVGLIREHEGDLALHEHSLVKCLSGECSEKSITEQSWQEAHQEEADQHIRLRLAHERIKRTHHMLISRLALLTEAMQKNAESS